MDAAQGSNLSGLSQIFKGRLTLTPELSEMRDPTDAVLCSLRGSHSRPPQR
jgi:hypothetical protein